MPKIRNNIFWPEEQGEEELRPFPNSFRKKRNRERKKLSRCFGFSVFFAVANFFYRYRTIETFYAHYISIFKYKFEMGYPVFLAEN